MTYRLGVCVRGRLKQFDESAFTSRRGSAAGTPPMSVKGIGGKGAFSLHSSNEFSPARVLADDVAVSLVAKPDYSESKIVVAMVSAAIRVVPSVNAPQES